MFAPKDHLDGWKGRILLVLLSRIKFNDEKGRGAILFHVLEYVRSHSPAVVVSSAFGFIIAVLLGRLLTVWYDLVVPVFSAIVVMTVVLVMFTCLCSLCCRYCLQAART